MPIESFGNNISTLNAANPLGSDAKSTADDHLRGIKSVLLAQFPNLNAPVTATPAQLNATYAPTASPAFTGTPTAPTATLGTNSPQLATTAFMANAIANVNAQTATMVSVVAGTTQAAVSGSHYILTNVAATTVTLPATPASGDTVWITPDNGLVTNVVNFNGQAHQNVTWVSDPTMTLDSFQPTYAFRFVNNKWRFV